MSMRKLLPATTISPVETNVHPDFYPVLEKAEFAPVFEKFGCGFLNLPILTEDPENIEDEGLLKLREYHSFRLREALEDALEGAADHSVDPAEYLGALQSFFDEKPRSAWEAEKAACISWHLCVGWHINSYALRCALILDRLDQELIDEAEKNGTSWKGKLHYWIGNLAQAELVVRLDDIGYPLEGTALLDPDLGYTGWEYHPSSAGKSFLAETALDLLKDGIRPETIGSVIGKTGHASTLDAACRMIDEGEPEELVDAVIAYDGSFEEAQTIREAWAEGLDISVFSRHWIGIPGLHNTSMAEALCGFLRAGISLDGCPWWEFSPDTLAEILKLALSGDTDGAAAAAGNPKLSSFEVKDYAAFAKAGLADFYSELAYQSFGLWAVEDFLGIRKGRTIPDDFDERVRYCRDNMSHLKESGRSCSVLALYRHGIRGALGLTAEDFEVIEKTSEVKYFMWTEETPDEKENAGWAELARPEYSPGQRELIRVQLESHPGTDVSGISPELSEKEIGEYFKKQAA